MQIKEDLDKLIHILPKSIQKTIENHPKKDILVEIVMDLGRRPEARFLDHPEYLSPELITWQDLDYSVKKLSKFNDDNRAGIQRTLHRISCIRNRQGLIIGLTCRVGRALYGTINIIRDLLESRKSILILGRPGVGKTTMIREIARVLANEMEKRVIIIDTANEIAGDSDVPHVGIGRARRMQVEKTDLQHKIMIEGVENHMPEVIIIDEIGTELEALAAQTIAERGVQLIGTAHGNSLGSLIKNPVLSNLIGDLQSVTLSDEEARRRGTQKTITERKGLPVFQIAIELNTRESWTIHENVEISIDTLLQERDLTIQVRRLEGWTTRIFLVKASKFILPIYRPLSPYKKAQRTVFFKQMARESMVKCNKQKNKITNRVSNDLINKNLFLRVYLHSVSSHFLPKKINQFNVIVQKRISERILRNDFSTVDIVIGLQSHLLTNKPLLQRLNKKGIPIFLIFDNTKLSLTTTISNIANSSELHYIEVLKSS